MRTFAIITVPANELVAAIHDRMPAILHREGSDRWLGSEPDPHDALQPFPFEGLRMWPISTRVNSPMNDDEDLLAEIPLPAPLTVAMRGSTAGPRPCNVIKGSYVSGGSASRPGAPRSDLTVS